MINNVNIKRYSRDITFDLIKCYAMLSVVMDHTIKRWVDGIQTTQLYNFIFLSQMPIFMFVAGYFFYRNIERKYSVQEFLKRILHLFLSYIVPFISFVILTSIISFDFKGIGTNIVAAFLMPDNSLWFLWTLFWIELLMLCAQQITNSISRKGINKWRLFLASIGIYVVELIPFLILYKCFPLYFQSKLIVYYSVFFILGSIFMFIRQNVTCLNMNVAKVIILICSLVVVCMVMITHPVILYEAETVTNMIVRMVGSFASIFMIWSLMELISKNKLIAQIAPFGKYTLEMYYIHLILLSFQFTHHYLPFGQPTVSVLYSMLYAIVILLSAILIYLLKKVKFLDFLLFGKYKRMLKLERGC